MTGLGPSAAALVAVVLTLTACGTAAGEPSAPPTATSAAPSVPHAPAASPEPAVPSPEPSQTDPHADWQRVETPNGTASFRIPPGWTARIEGGETEYDGELHWGNSITLADAEGVGRLLYGDGPGDDVAVAPLHWGVVVSAPVASLDEDERARVEVHDPASLDHAATAWWTSHDGAVFWAHVALTREPGADSVPTAWVIDGERLVGFATHSEFAAEADAVAWLQSAEAELYLEIISTLDLTAVASPALPDP
jgi:hypothetical protein